MMGSGDRQPVGADLVGHIPSLRDAVRSDKNAVDESSAHGRSGRAVDAHTVGHAGCCQFPRGQPGTLQEWPGFIDEDLGHHSGFSESEDGPEGGTHGCGREPAGVAVGKQPQGALRAAIPDGLGRVCDHPSVDRSVLVNHGGGLGKNRVRTIGELAEGSVDRPGQVDGRRAGCGKSPGVGVHSLSPRAGDARPAVGVRRKRDAQGSRESDRGGAPHREGRDGGDDIIHGGQAQKPALVRQRALVEGDDRVFVPAQRCRVGRLAHRRLLETGKAESVSPSEDASAVRPGRARPPHQ